MNQSASHLTHRKVLPGAVQRKKTLLGRMGWEKDVSNREWMVPGKVTFLWEKADVC